MNEGATCFLTEDQRAQSRAIKKLVFVIFVCFVGKKMKSSTRKWFHENAH